MRKIERRRKDGEEREEEKEKTRDSRRVGARDATWTVNHASPGFIGPTSLLRIMRMLRFG
jgi:hypothetical protein